MVNRYIVGPIGQMYMDEVTTDDLRLLMVPLSQRFFPECMVSSIC